MPVICVIGDYDGRSVKEGRPGVLISEKCHKKILSRFIERTMVGNRHGNPCIAEKLAIRASYTWPY